MKNAWIFARRNITESVRDPILYIFAAGFPIGMLGLFALISHFAGGSIPGFAMPSLVPGILVFSYTFVMLVMSLLVSKDRHTAFLRRLYTSPMRPADFVIGYALPGILIGIAQSVLAVCAGALLAAVSGERYFSLPDAALLILSQIPMLVLCVFLGILFGALLSEKAAPGVTSVFITSSGILGGCWMPLDTMGSFETFARFLPFYPSVVFGRIITGAEHTVTVPDVPPALYTFDTAAALGILPIAVTLAAALVLSFVTFSRQASRG